MKYTKLTHESYVLDLMDYYDNLVKQLSQEHDNQLQNVQQSQEYVQSLKNKYDSSVVKLQKNETFNF